MRKNQYKQPISHESVKTTDAQGSSASLKTPADFEYNGNRYKDILESMEEVYYEVDLQGKLTFFNAAAVKNFGYAPAELMGMNFREYMDKKTAEDIFKIYNYVYETGETIKGFDYELINKNGEKIPVETSISPNRDEQGNCIGFKGISRDVSKRKHAEDQLKKYRDHLEDLINERTSALTRANGLLIKEIEERKEIDKALKDSETNYRTLFENLQDVFYRTDSKGLLLVASPSIQKTLGYTLDEISGLDIAATFYMHPEQRSLFLKHLQEKGNVEDYEIELKHKDGSPVWISANSQVYHDAEGNILGVEGMFRNITERKRSEQALKDAEKEYRSLFDGANDAIFILVEGKFAECNQMALTMFACTRKEELVGHAPMEFSPPLQPDGSGSDVKALEVINKALKGVPQRFYWKHLRKDEVEFDAEVSLNCIEMEEKQFIQAIVRDITVHKKAEDSIRELNKTLENRVKKRTKDLEAANTELKQVMKQLEDTYNELKLTHSQMLQQDKMASIGQLAAGVAHEINNPIGFISSNLGTLGRYVDKLTEFVAAETDFVKRSGDGSALADIDKIRKSFKIDYITEDVKDLIKESLEGADRVKKIVQDLKSFSRVDQAEYKSAQINECMESTLNIVWNELKYKATVTKEFGDIPPIKCYPQQLNQVFMNLLVNAAHAIEKQGVITIRTWRENESVLISVADTGSGIRPEIVNRIFEPFFTTKEVGKGTGLGLSITYDIIKKHSGEISVQSEVGKGTTFTVRIPIVEE